MRATTILIFFLSLSLLPAVQAHAADHHMLLQPAADDLVATSVTSAKPTKSGPAVSMDPVTFCWPLSKETVISSRPSAHMASSREFHLLVPTAELSKGVEFHTTAPGALIRLNPSPHSAASKSSTLSPEALILVGPEDREYPDGSGMIRLADAEAIKASGAPFAEGTTAFQIDPRLGHGRFILRAPGLDRRAASAFAIHVFDKASQVTLSAVAERPEYLQGQVLSAIFRFEGFEGLESAEAEVSLRSPDGKSFPATLRQAEVGLFQAEAVLKQALDLTEGLWEVHATAVARSGDLEIRRDVHTAFAVASPTARFLGRISVDRADALVFSLPVEAGSAGRYEARALLYGTDSAGNLQPLATAHAAAFFAAGVATLDLEFPADIVRSSGLTAPFELRDLQLGDQGRMSRLHRQARALVLE